MEREEEKQIIKSVERRPEEHEETVYTAVADLELAPPLPLSLYRYVCSSTIATWPHLKLFPGLPIIQELDKRP